MLEGARRHRETFAWVLVGFVAVRVLVELLRLFTGQGFTVNAAVHHVDFVSPVHAGALALAVWLVVTGSEPTARAREVVVAALAAAGAAVFVGIVAWLGGLTVHSFVQSTGQKVAGSLLFLAGAGLVGTAAWFGVLVLERLPSQVRPRSRRSPAPWGQPDWGGHDWDARHGQAQQWSHRPRQDHGAAPAQHGQAPSWQQPHSPPAAERPRYEALRTGWGQAPGDTVEAGGFDAGGFETGGEGKHQRQRSPWARAADVEPTEGLSIFDPVGAAGPDADVSEVTHEDDDTRPDDTRVDEAGDVRDGWPPRSS